VPDLCTGCDLCVNPCPVDCIVMYPVTETTGWDAWRQADADAARERHDFRAFRLKREKDENDARLAAKAEAKMAAVQALDPADAAGEAEKERKRAIIAAAMERARLKKEESSKE
jgi:electron transport complex protein RnfB